MKSEIIAVGSEMLTPFRQDTNSLYLTEKLNEIGVTVAFKTIVGDRRKDLVRRDPHGAGARGHRDPNGRPGPDGRRPDARSGGGGAFADAAPRRIAGGRPARARRLVAHADAEEQSETGRCARRRNGAAQSERQCAGASGSIRCIPAIASW